MDVEEGSWITHSPRRWSHDGEPYRATYCTVFSDGASVELKKQAASLADCRFMEIMEVFEFTTYEDLIYPTERNTIDVYINRFHPENIAEAYWGSIFITVRTQELDEDRYAYLFGHELTHVFEFLIEGAVNFAGEMWFTEGIAILVGGGLHRINNADDLNQWISSNENFPNGGNPIAIEKWEDYPEGSDKTGYYTVFEVVMEYLLAEKGLGKSMSDVLNVFYDLRARKSFKESFNNNFGIGVDVLEQEIFDRLTVYFSTD